MSATNSFHSGQQATSPTFGLSLNSNNPFRNRAASPASFDARASQSSPFDDPAPTRPLSRNPFLDRPPPQERRGSDTMASTTARKEQTADDFFQSLSLEEAKPRPDAPTRNEQPRRPAEPRRGENKPPPPPSGAGMGKHRPTRSQEEALKAKRAQQGDRRPGPSSPQRRPQRRPRRNSESSVLDLDAMPLTEEEKKMIEAKRQRDRMRRERDSKEKGEGSRDRREGKDGRDREGKDSRDREGRTRESRDGKDGAKRSKSGRPSRKMDIIDQLDATSIYGTGVFHHDGPFDALNPHRNKGTSRRAPMQAFPKDSLNNALGGFGPISKQSDHKTLMGNGTDEAFRDYSYSGKSKSSYSYPTSDQVFDPHRRGEIVHGDESYGLGTSTFLEGTPAARSAIQKHEAEQQQTNAEGGLQRKKSLAQRIRHINKGPRDFSSGRVTSPDAYGSKRTPDAVQSGGGSVASNDNPFFSEFGKGEDVLTVRPRDGALSPNTPPRPRRGSHNVLERRATTESTVTPEEPAPKPTGLLGRMKSLKGPRKPKSPDVSSNLPSNSTQAA